MIYESDMGTFDNVPQANRMAYKKHFERICLAAKQKEARLILDPNLSITDKNLLTIADKGLDVRSVISRIEDLQAELNQLRSLSKK